MHPGIAFGIGIGIGTLGNFIGRKLKIKSPPEYFQCDRKFYFKKTLIRHMKIDHGTEYKKFKCPEQGCNMYFRLQKVTDWLMFIKSNIQIAAIKILSLHRGFFMNIKQIIILNIAVL